MAASWLKNYLAPVRFLVNSIAQIRDDRVNFRNGFTASQVPDADGVNVLTIDTVISNTQYEPIPNTVPIRNGSGTLKGATITAASFTYTSPVTIEYDEPLNMNAAPFDSNWTLNFNRFPVANSTGISWFSVVKPPDGSTLKSVSVAYMPPSGHGSLPLTTDRSMVGLIEYAEDGSATSHGTAYDNPADVPSYEGAYRVLSLDLGAGIVINWTRTYVFVFKTEGGANALPGTIIYRPARWTAEVMNPICV